MNIYDFGVSSMEISNKNWEVYVWWKVQDHHVKQEK